MATTETKALSEGLRVMKDRGSRRREPMAQPRGRMSLANRGLE